MSLIEFGLNRASEADKQALFSNVVAGLSGLIRASQGLQAAAMLAVFGFYTEARATIRGVYESAGVARMLAHDPEVSEKWMRKNEWIPDRRSREFAAAMAGGDEDAKIPHQEYYKRASASAHPSALTTLPYMFDSNGNIRAMLYPEFNADLFISLSNEITVEALFVAYCFKNALADPDMMPPDWYRALAQHAREFSGLPLDHLEDDWEERERRFRSLHSQVRPAEEIDDFLRAHPNSAYNLKQRAGEGVNNIHPGQRAEFGQSSTSTDTGS